MLDTAGYVPPNGDIYGVLTGRWAWASDTAPCAGTWSAITFDSGHTVMTITPNEAWKDEDGSLVHETVYDLTEHRPDRLVGAIRGEKRLTAAGTPVVWEIILLSDTSYVWHRTDWPGSGRTGASIRCPEPADGPA